MLRVSRRQVVQGMGAVGLALGAGCGRWPGQAQPPQRVYRIGVLSETPPGAQDLAFRQGLHDLGYTEEHNVVIEFRWAAGQVDRLPALAAELVRLPVDVLVAGGNPSIRAAMDATSTIPIVFTVAGDPVGRGFVQSLARPGGNVTGLSNLGRAVEAKRLQLLAETVGGIRLAVLWDANLGALPEEYEATARPLGVQLQIHAVHRSADLLDTLETIVRERAQAVHVPASGMAADNAPGIIDFTLQHNLPTMFGWRVPVDAGGLMAYGPSINDLSRRAAYYVDRILKGTKPADLPVEQPREFEFVINLKTAQALGLTIPEHVLLQATEVIQ